MNATKLCRKIFFKNKPLVLISLISAICCLSFFGIGLYRMLENTFFDVFTFFSYSLTLSAISFVFFCLISFEYFLKIKSSDLIETIATTPKGKNNVYLSQFKIMVELITCFSFSVLFLNTICIAIWGEITLELLCYFILAVFLYIFLTNLLAVIIGLTLSTSFSRLVAYVNIIEFVVLSSPLINLIADSLIEANINIYWICNLFNIFPVNLDWSVNYHFGYSILPYIFFIILFWIFVSLTLFIYNTCDKHKKASLGKLAFTTVLSVACVTGSFLPSSKLEMNMQPETGVVSIDNYYYQKEQRIEKANFEVDEYKIDLKISLQLNAIVTMDINKGNLPEYKFTLYHGYNVKKVFSDKNVELKYKQENDYLTVFNSDDNLKSIKIYYNGSCPKFYSNIQGVFLPNYFAFYPQSGFKSMYSNGSFDRNFLDKNTKISIKIHSLKKFYCNLDETEKNVFEGKANSVTLLSGFLTSLNVDDVEVVYPYVNKGDFSPNDIIRGVEKNRKNGIIENDVKKIFIIPNVNTSSDYERFIKSSEHLVLTNISDLKNIYEMQKLNKAKLSLYGLLDKYENFNDIYQGIIETSYQFEEKPEENIYVQFDKILKQYDNYIVLEKCHNYISDDDDKRTIDEFFNDLSEEQ